MDTAIRQFLDVRAQCPLRGHSLPDLVTESQQIQYDIDNITVFPGDYLMMLQADDPLSTDERVAQLRYYWGKRFNWLKAELDRRRNIKAVALPDQQTVQAIKEAAGGQGLADMIGQYTDVFVDKKQWQFRCPLHEDKHPSGVIYRDESRWHCFQCQADGDVLDAVMKFGRMGFPEALARVARYAGIELREKKQATAFAGLS